MTEIVRNNNNKSAGKGRCARAIRSQALGPLHKCTNIQRYEDRKTQNRRSRLIATSSAPPILPFVLASTSEKVADSHGLETPSCGDLPILGLDEGYGTLVDVETRLGRIFPSAFPSSPPSITTLQPAPAPAKGGGYYIHRRLAVFSEVFPRPDYSATFEKKIHIPPKHPASSINP